MAKKKKLSQPIPAWAKYAWWVIPVLAILVYIPAFDADFTLDDVLIVEDNEYIKSADKLPRLWTTHYWAGKMDASDTGLYRPLTLTSYAIQYITLGDNPVPFHVLNILLHALTCFILMKFVKLLFNDNRLAILSGLIFAIHPVHTEAVAGIVGRAEIMASLFILLSGICYHHWKRTGNLKWLGGLIVSTFAAITSKEHGFMIPLILGLQETTYYLSVKKYQWSSGRTWLAIGSVMLVAIILWIIRSAVTGPSVPHEEWLHVNAMDRMATSVRITFEYIGMHLFPLKLSADYWSKEVPVVGWGNFSVIVALFSAIALLGIAVWQRNRMRSFSWGIFFFFLTLAPVSNFLFAAGFLKAERILYIPSIGLIVAISALLVKLYDTKNLKILAIGLAGAFTLFFIARTWVRAGDWKNNYTLAEATLKVSPDSPRFNNMMGLELRALGQNQEALSFFEKAVKGNPNHVPALVNLGTEYKTFNRPAEAAATLERALEIDPNTLATYVNLMSIYRSMENHDKSLEVAKKAVARFPQSAAVLWNAANAYQLKNDMVRANELRARARAIQPDIGM